MTSTNCQPLNCLSTLSGIQPSPNTTNLFTFNLNGIFKFIQIQRSIWEEEQVERMIQMIKWRIQPSCYKSVSNLPIGVTSPELWTKFKCKMGNHFKCTKVTKKSRVRGMRNVNVTWERIHSKKNLDKFYMEYEYANTKTRLYLKYLTVQRNELTGLTTCNFKYASEAFIPEEGQWLEI
jgi:hypothetical protein